MNDRTSVRAPAAFPLRLAKFLRRQGHGFAQAFAAVRCRREYARQEPWPPHTPLVSVVIPCFNYGEFVGQAIESVLAQTFQRFEVIVIDDGSTDPLTRRTLDRSTYVKTRIVRQANQGLAATRNRGAMLAAGKYVCYLDADDSLEPTYLQKTLETLETDGSLGSCYSWVRCFGEIDGVWQTRDLDPFFLHRGTTAPSHSVIRKQAWMSVKEMNGAGFLTKYDGYFEDWVFWIDMIQCGYRGQVIPEALIRHRVHGDSLGARHKAGFGEKLSVLHAERRDFFESPQYRRTLSRRLNRRLFMENARINIANRHDEAVREAGRFELGKVNGK